MKNTTLWKSVAGVAGALGLLLGSAGATVHVAESPTPDCHSAEHAGLGMVINCQNQHKG